MDAADELQRAGQRGDVQKLPRLSVIIPAHDAASTIVEQLEALVDQRTNVAFEVIVVDNQSNDGQLAVFKEDWNQPLC